MCVAVDNKDPLARLWGTLLDIYIGASRLDVRPFGVHQTFDRGNFPHDHKHRREYPVRLADFPVAAFSATMSALKWWREKRQTMHCGIKWPSWSHLSMPHPSVNSACIPAPSKVHSSSTLIRPKSWRCFGLANRPGYGNTDRIGLAPCRKFNTYLTANVLVTNGVSVK